MAKHKPIKIQIGESYRGKKVLEFAGVKHYGSRSGRGERTYKIQCENCGNIKIVTETYIKNAVRRQVSKTCMKCYSKKYRKNQPREKIIEIVDKHFPPANLGPFYG